MPSTSANSSRTKWQNQHWKLMVHARVFVRFHLAKFRRFCHFGCFGVWSKEHSKKKDGYLSAASSFAMECAREKQWAVPLLVEPVDCLLLHCFMCQAEMSLWLFFKSMKLSGVTLCDFTAWSQGLLFLWCHQGILVAKKHIIPTSSSSSTEMRRRKRSIEWSTSKDLSEDDSWEMLM